MKEFFVIVDGQQQGPFTMGQLAEMAITPETEVWTQGMDDWRQAGDVPELTALLQQLQFQHHMDTTPPPYSGRATTADESVPTAWAEPQQPLPQQPEPKRGGSGCGTNLLLALLIVVILGGVLAVTCPSRQDHKDAIATSSREWMSTKIQAANNMGGLGNLLNGVVEWISGKGIDFAVDEYLDVDNYFVCSVGRFRVGNERKTVSLGVLNHVFTFDKDDVDNFLLNAVKDQTGIDNQAPSQPQEMPPAEEDEDDSYLAPPVEEDTLLQSAPNPAEELLDSLATQAKRQAIQTAKEWAKKQIDRIGQP